MVTHQKDSSTSLTSILNLTVLITGLGYFVDSFDAFSFNVYRVKSLTDLGLAGDDLTNAGIFILNCQVAASLIGGIIWGVLGDKIGRKKALLGSILLYSIGMIASAMIESVDQYAAARALVGFGIAGEVGLGATLVAEVMQSTKRTYSLAFFTALGLLGVATAAISIEFIDWRTGYLAGGVAGFLLLFLRHKLFESPLFDDLFKENARRGRFQDILMHIPSLKRWLACIFILAPNFFVTGILLTLAPEITKAAGIVGVKANIALAAYFTMSLAGDFGSAFFSEKIKSRKIPIFIFLLSLMCLSCVYIYNAPQSLNAFYVLCASFGVFNIWAIATITTTEQFPTHLRATVTTSSMNFARGCILPMNLGILYLKPLAGVSTAAFIVGGCIFALGFISLLSLKETFGEELEHK